MMGRIRRSQGGMNLCVTNKHDWARHKNDSLKLTNKMSNLIRWKKTQVIT